MATAYAKADRERQAATEAEMTTQQLAARREYAERTDRLLAAGITELREAPAMQPTEYQREVKPRIMHILGSLEAGRPTDADSAFVARHDRLVSDLKGLVAEFDKYFDKVERGETDGMEHTVRRCPTPGPTPWAPASSGSRRVTRSRAANHSPTDPRS